jgi:hypothetical protein
LTSRKDVILLEVMHHTHYLLIGAALFLQGCCTGDPCWEKFSGPDRDRVGAVKINSDVVYNDTVSTPKGDRTDWKYVLLSRPGKLTVLLHWDNGRARLEFDMFDVMGMKVQEGRVWGAGGLRAVLAVEEPGPYYMRVRASGKEDESQYALRANFAPEKKGEVDVCHNCKVGERKCLGTTAFVGCEKVGPACTAWTQTTPCPAGVTCRDGACGVCGSPCTEGTTRCSDHQVQTCVKAPNAPCAAWAMTKPCAAGQRCQGGRCVRGARPKKQEKVEVRPPPEVPRAAIVRGKIISLYRHRGVWTLHIEIGENPSVKPGQIGMVLEGETTKPLPGGEVKITKVAGRYAIATTSLLQVGKNRWVRIDTK